MTPRVVVTGVGLISALGKDRETNWQSIIAGRCGIGPVDLFDVSVFPAKNGAQIRFPIPLPELQRGDERRLSRCDRLALAAAAEALADAGGAPGDGRFGLAVGAGAGGMMEAEHYSERFVREGPETRAPLRDLYSFMPNATAEWISRTFRLGGPRVTVATACSSSATAIGIAADWIRSGRADRALAGGADALSIVTWSGFNSLRAVDPDTCRPFDRKRAGISLGEGAGFIVLEREDRAAGRKRAIFSGYGVTSDAFHMTNPLPEGSRAGAAISAALASAGVSPGDVDYVNAHGTGTPANDAAESKAIRLALGDGTKACVSSTKSQVGHTLGAAGGVEAAVTVLAVERGVAPPNVSLAEIDPACLPVDVVVGRGRERKIRHAVSNSFAFGGNNCALVFSRVAP